LRIACKFSISSLPGEYPLKKTNVCSFYS